MSGEHNQIIVTFIRCGLNHLHINAQNTEYIFYEQYTLGGLGTNPRILQIFLKVYGTLRSAKNVYHMILNLCLVRFKSDQLSVFNLTVYHSACL